MTGSRCVALGLALIGLSLAHGTARAADESAAEGARGDGGSSWAYDLAGELMMRRIEPLP